MGRGRARAGGARAGESDRLRLKRAKLVVGSRRVTRSRHGCHAPCTPCDAAQNPHSSPRSNPARVRAGDSTPLPLRVRLSGRFTAHLGILMMVIILGAQWTLTSLGIAKAGPYSRGILEEGQPSPSLEPRIARDPRRRHQKSLARPPQTFPSARCRA